MTDKQRHDKRIPRGWHLIRLGTLIRAGDFYWCVDHWRESVAWGVKMRTPGVAANYIRKK